MDALGVFTRRLATAHEIASHSRGALDRPLTCDAELWVVQVTSEARLLGAFQRSGVDSRAARGSGGPTVDVGPGAIHVALALAHPAALVACEPSRIVNRYVRPLLRALTKLGATAHYFGRDWVSVAHRPAAWIGFAHDTTTRRTLFEAFVAVRAPFTNDARASFRGKEAGALEAIIGRAFDVERARDAIVLAYGAGRAIADLADPSYVAGVRAPSERPWAATCEEPIGTIGAGPDDEGVLRVGGDLLVSRDALARLEARIGAGERDVGRAVDETLGAPGVAIEGVRSLASVADVIARARVLSGVAGA